MAIQLRQTTMAGIWAAVVLILVLSLAAHPAEARSPKTMMDTKWLSLGRNTGRHLMVSCS